MRFRLPVSRAFSFSAALACVALGEAGCARRETPVEAGIRTHTLLIGNQSEPASLDPDVVNAYTDQIVLAALFEGLTVLDEKSCEARPGVAEKWETTADGLVYTFHLRADARWSNGDPVTARDFAYTFQRMLSPALAAEYSYMLWPIKNAEAFNKGTVKDFSAVGIEVVDERTLRLGLERPTSYLPALAAHGTWLPVHRATIEKFGRADDRANPWTRPGNMVGNGPFTLTEWTPNARIVVTKNPRYWDAAHTWLERVVFFPTEKADTEDHNFRAGQLHLTFDVPKSKITAYRAPSSLGASKRPGEDGSPLRIDPLFSITYVNFNVTKPPFTDVRVRRALALAIDREALSRNVLFGAWPPAHSITPPNCGGYTARAGVLNDFAAARRLLAESGHAGGAGLPAVPIQVLNDEAEPRLAEALQAMWQRELGVRVTIEPYEQKTWLQNQQSLAHTLGTMGWTADFADPVTFLDIFRTGNGNNWTGWGNQDYDALLDQAANTADAHARFELLQKAEALLLEAAPVAPLVYRARTYLIHPAVKNWEPSPLGLHRFQLVELKN